MFYFISPQIYYAIFFLAYLMFLCLKFDYIYECLRENWSMDDQD